MEPLSHMYLLWILDLGLLMGIICVLLAFYVPGLNCLLEYGKTHTKITSLEWLYVPKRWFIHFYYLHLMLASGFLFWYLSTTSKMDIQLVVVLLMNLCQASRRLYECLYVSKWTNASKMHVTHYFAGVYFYSSINVIPFLLNWYHVHPLQDFTILILIVISFLALSWDQFKNHCHLASLKKYSLPTRGLFRYVVCAHYLDEVLIYMLFAVLYPSISYLLVSLWVFVNLSVSADGSWHWYQKKGLLEADTLVKRIIPYFL